MELVTLCPHCQTRFSVSIEQLQRRKGYIRCAQCAAIFDGFEHVLADDDERYEEASTLPADKVQSGQTVVQSEPVKSAAPAAVEPEEFSAQTLTTERRDNVDLVRTVHTTPEDQLAQHEYSRDHRENDALFFVSASQSSSLDTQESAWRIRDENHDDTAPILLARDRDRGYEHRYDRYRESHDLPRSFRLAQLFWILVVLMLLGGLAVQALYTFRLQIANAVPMTRPALELLCDKLGCTVPYVRNIADIKVVASALQVQNAGSKTGRKQYQLRVRLRNTDTQPQEWPTLVVTFTDVAAAVVARVDVPPSQYLTTQQLTAPFAAQSEIEFVLPIQSVTPINGYKIDKYFR